MSSILIVIYMIVSFYAYMLDLLPVPSAYPIIMASGI